MSEKYLRFTFQITFLLIVLVLLVNCSSLQTSTRPETQFNDTHIEEVLLDYAFSPNGATLGIYTNVGVYLYDLATMKETTFIEFDNKDQPPTTTYGGRGGAIAFSYDGMQIAVSGGFKGDPIKIFDADTYEYISTISLGLPEHTVIELEFSPTDESIVIRNRRFDTDLLVLYSFPRQEIVFEVDKIVNYPPIQFNFTKDEKLFLHLQSMSPEYTVYFVDSITGAIVNEPCQWGENDGFFGSSVTGATIQLLQECFPAETLDEIHSKGEILLFPNINHYIIHNFSLETNDGEHPIELWENGERVCEFETFDGFPSIKASANEQIFAYGKHYPIGKTYDYQLFVWDVDSCEKIGVWQFDSSE
jgi:WD40 repeat protein